ncbi:MAG: thymidine phosphorylase [bacterium]|jgi:pyrimidine-nucleoside phosphorylase
MLPQWIIEKKRNGGILSDQELTDFIGGYVRGDIPDYQMAALAMAIFFRGMTPEEITSLTRVMMHSGDIVDTSSILRPKVDKHSTGGIGDKLSIPLAPIVACCGVAVPMISGRGLGITGGTLDKLESIPGYRTGLQIPEFINVLQSCGCSLIGQTERLVPADRKLYALRDVTATVPSIPLIVSSIMSKKLAEGLDGLVLDVKCGRGAFMKTRDEARALAEALVRVGRAMGKRVTALITAMDQPLGRAVGNSLEIMESIDILKGRGPADSTELTLALAAEMLVVAGVVPTPEAGLEVVRRKWQSGEPFEVFKKMVRLHGGDTEFLDDPRCFPIAKMKIDFTAVEKGFVQDVDAEKIGRASLLLGAGRAKTTDAIDYSAGLSNLMKIGEPVVAGAPLATLHAATQNRIDAAMGLVREAFVVGPASVPSGPLVLERV